MQAAAAAGTASAPSTAAAAAAPKRKPAPPKGVAAGRKKKVVCDSEDEGGVTSSSEGKSDASKPEARPAKDVYEMEAFSPAVAPKVRNVSWEVLEKKRNQAGCMH